MKRVGNKGKEKQNPKWWKEKQLVTTTRLMPTLSLSSSPSANLPPAFLLGMMPHGLGCPLGQLASVILAVLPSKPLCTPRLLMDGMGWAAGKALALSTLCSATIKTLLCHQHCFQHHPKLNQVPWKKLNLSQPKPSNMPGVVSKLEITVTSFKWKNL